MAARPGHDKHCEWGERIPLDMGGLPAKFATREDCGCARRAYERDPLPGAEPEPEGDDGAW